MILLGNDGDSLYSLKKKIKGFNIMYRIFIIGAGFSKPAGLPLGNELWKLVLNQANIEQPFYDLLKPDIQAYLKYQKKVHDKEINVEDIEIEDLISYLDVEHFLRLKGNDTFSEEGNRGQIILKNLIAKVIFKVQKSISSEALELYDNFCSFLHETDVIINFNYDTLIENSLERVNKPFRLYHSTETKEEIKKICLLKIHGSINWFDKTYYNKSCDILKQNGSNDPYNVYGQIFSDPTLFKIEQLLKEPAYDDNPLNNVYVLNNLNTYFEKQDLLSGPPLIISPSFFKLVYLNRIKSFWDSFNITGIFNSSLNIIGYSFPVHDRYLIQPISKAIINFQEHSEFANLNIGREYKKHKLKIIDYKKDKSSITKFQERLKFINWNDSIFFSNGFNENAIHEIFH